jgi:hypothetical protein
MVSRRTHAHTRVRWHSWCETRRLRSLTILSEAKYYCFMCVDNFKLSYVRLGGRAWAGKDDDGDVCWCSWMMIAVVVGVIVMVVVLVVGVIMMVVVVVVVAAAAVVAGTIPEARFKAQKCRSSQKRQHFLRFQSSLLRPARAL